MNRRDSLKLMLGVAAGSALTGLTTGTAVLGQNPPTAAPAAPATPPPTPGPFSLPPLGYAYDALEPHIDAATMKIHHTGHHAAYVKAINALAEKHPELTKKPIEAILADLDALPEAIRTPVRNNLGGHWNHTFFWDLMVPGGAKAPAGDLKAAVDAAFGGLPQLTEKVNDAGAKRFGSGWAWLAVDKAKKLVVVSSANQDSPHTAGLAGAVLGVDVWEHAYYLKHQNKRADYLKAWWNTVNWDKAAANFKTLMA